MLWVWSFPVGTKEVFLKRAVRKRQAKFLKTTCEVASIYYIYRLYTRNLLKTILSQAFFAKFTKLHVIPFIWNSKIYFAGAFKHFSPFQIITLLPFSSQIFGVTFFLEHLSVVVSANTYLIAISKKLKQFPEITCKCRKFNMNSL